MKNNFQYYFYLNSQQYKQLYKHTFVLVTALLLLAIFTLISVIFITQYILNFQKLDTFQMWLVCGILLPMVWFLGYMILCGIMSIRKVYDIFVTDKGINLPFPYDAKTKETFIKYEDIEKIIVYINPQNILNSLIVFYLNKNVKPWIIFLPKDNKISLTSVNPYKFIDSIKRASGNRIPIEFKWWKELYLAKV